MNMALGTSEQQEPKSTLHAFFDRFEEIAQRPYSFEDVSYIASGYRRCISGVDTIYFRVENESVEIMTIIGRQEFNP